jgi:translation initiation factor 2 subunit 3
MSLNFNEIINNQPTVNIGCLGSVTDGKSSMVNSICGIKTQRHSSEHIKNITIKLGYANAKIFKCSSCPEPSCYESYDSKKKKAKCENCESNMELIKHISFVDCPGHNDLLLTMMSGVSVMDHSIVVVSAADNIQEKRQLKEHISAANVSELNNYIVCLNKLDLIDRDTAKNKYDELNLLLKNTPIENAQVIPTSFNRGYNKKWLLHHICTELKEVDRDLESPPIFRITRSFDINKPGSNISDLLGGVLGGTLVKGKMNVGDVIEIRPGIVKKTDKSLAFKPLLTTITSIKSENNSLTTVIPGGLIGIGTDLDAYYTKNDTAVGNTIGHPGSLPDVYTDIEGTYTVMEKMFDNSDPNIFKIKPNEMVLINVNSISIACKVTSISSESIKLNLVGKLLCLEEGDIIIISKKLAEGCKIVGKAIFTQGLKAVML